MDQSAQKTEQEIKAVEKNAISLIQDTINSDNNHRNMLSRINQILTQTDRQIYSISVDSFVTEKVPA